MKRNPHPHVKLRGGPEVIAWPDGVVGLSFAYGFSQLYSPDKAERIGRALIAMAKAARAAR